MTMTMTWTSLVVNSAVCLLFCSLFDFLLMFHACRFTLINSSLKVWEGNEYVSAACFEFLAALYAKCVMHDFPGIAHAHVLGFTACVHRSLVNAVSISHHVGIIDN
jgi:hypothetical protein